MCPDLNYVSEPRGECDHRDRLLGIGAVWCLVAAAVLTVALIVGLAA